MSEKECDLVIQTERPIHEGTINYVMCFAHHESSGGWGSTCPSFKAYKGETMFFGRGSKQAATKAMRLMRDVAG